MTMRVAQSHFIPAQAGIHTFGMRAARDHFISAEARHSTR